MCLLLYVNDTALYISIFNCSAVLQLFTIYCSVELLPHVIHNKYCGPHLRIQTCTNNCVFRYFGCDQTGPLRPHRRASGPVTSFYSPRDSAGLRGSPATGGGKGTIANCARISIQSERSHRIGSATHSLPRKPQCPTCLLISAMECSQGTVLGGNLRVSGSLQERPHACTP